MTRKIVIKRDRDRRATSKDKAVEERVKLEQMPLNVSRTQPPPKTKPGGGKLGADKPQK